MTIASPIRRRRAAPASPLPLLLLALVAAASGRTIHDVNWAFDMADLPVLEVNAGDALVVSWTGTGRYDHNVIVMASGACDETDGDVELSSARSSGVEKIELAEEDAAPGGREMALACTYDNHCRRNGMLLRLRVYPPGCSVCGEGKYASDSDAAPGLGDAGSVYPNATTCGELEVAGRRGEIPPGSCGELESILEGGGCACAPVPTSTPTTTPTDMPTEKSEVGAESAATMVASSLSLGASLAAAGILLVLGGRAA